VKHIKAFTKIKNQKSKLLLTFAFCILIFSFASCMPGGTQAAQGWAGIALHDDVLYTGSIDGKVIAVNATARELEWSYAISMPSTGMSCSQTSRPTPIYGTPAVFQDLCYVAAYSGRVYALNIITGRERWVYPKEGYMGAIVASPVVAGDTIYVSSSDGKVHALDATYGELKWSSEPLGEKLWITPAIEGDTIYVSTFEGYIYSLSTKDLSLLPWTFKANVGFVSSPVIYQDTIFVGAFDNNLYAIKIGESEPIWRFCGGEWFWATPVVKDGIVYAGCLDGKIYAINAKTGDLEWEFDTGSPIVSSPVWDGDLLIVASESGDIYVFDTHSEPENKVMMPAKTVPIDALIRGSLCVQDSTIYVRAQDNCLYALDIEKGWISWRLPLNTKGES